MLQIAKELVLLDAEAESAEEAIRMAGKLLVQAGKVEERYVDAMVKGFREIGPYIVLAPGIAIPHARPEHGVKEQCLSLVRLNEPVLFGHPDNDPVRLVCAIGGVDDSSHIGMLQALAAVLGDSEKLNSIMEANDYDQLVLALQ